MTVPSNFDFTTEVKTDRLTVLYRVTLIVALTALIFIAAFGVSGMAPGMGVFGLFGATLCLIVGSLATRYYLNHDKLEHATWAYALGGVVGIGVALYQGDITTLQTLPFFFPLIIFIVGLLISPVSTFVLAAISSAVIILVPNAAGYSTNFIDIQQSFAIFLMFLSALLASQVTGELYQITEWALMNYQRERRTNNELFEKRQALQLSLKRSEALADKLQETNDELEDARTAAEEAKNFRGQFLANMSHELRTPLNAIIGFSETMLEFPVMYDNKELPDPYARDLSQIFNSGRQLLYVINDILDLARVDAGKLEIHMQTIAPEAIVLAALSTAKGLIGTKPVNLDQDMPEEIPRVWVDETRLRQVLLNLYSNAVKYTDEGHIKLTVTVHDDELEFALEDTGIGIDPEYHDKLFQEFEQARSGGRDPRAGAGLGLAITKQLLDLMGGRIWMESEVGVGSTFYFTILRYDEQDKVEKKFKTLPKKTAPIPQQNTTDEAPAMEG